MAYDRYDPRGAPRDEHSRWSDRDERSRWRDDRHDRYQGGGSEGRGFFERARDEVASWFGDEDDGHRASQAHRPSGGEGRDRSSEPMGWRGQPDHDRDRHEDRPMWGQNRPRDREREWSPSSPWAGREPERGDRDRQDSDRERGYRPMTGDYGRSERSMGGYGQRQSEWDRDPYRSTSRAGSSDPSDRSRHEDPHYRSWRDRHLGELDRDYDDYRRENQSRFENDFSSWRERRQQKRGLLSQMREHMEVVGSDDQHVGTIDRIAGDRVILTKADPESGGAHHSLSCSEIDRVEGDRVILECSADQARNKWRDENRSRALFEREDQGEMGPGVLDRSFPGTYR